MATRTWSGRAKAVAQVSTIQVTAYDAATTYTVTVNGKSVTALAAGSVNLTAAALATAWAARAEAEFTDAVATSSTDTLTLTGATAGKPFEVTKSVSGGTGTLGSVTEATAPTGPNWWTDAVNWDEAAVPTAGDAVVINRGPSILYGINATGDTLASLTVGTGFPATAEIGLPANTNPSAPASGYPEYRPQRLTIGATLVEIETASRRIRLNLAEATATVLVRDTGQSAVATEDALDLVVDDAGGSSAVHVLKGAVGVNALPGDAGTLADLNVSYRTQQAGDAKVRGGPELTLTRLDQRGGEVTLLNGVVTPTNAGGTLNLVAGAVTTLTNRGGTVYHDGTGTITTLNNLGTFIRRGFRAATVTNATLYAGSQTSDPNGTLTWTNPPQLNQCRLPSGPDDRGPDVAYANFGTHRKLTVADI